MNRWRTKKKLTDLAKLDASYLINPAASNICLNKKQIIPTFSNYISSELKEHFFSKMFRNETLKH